MTDNKPYPDLHQIIRDAGGIVHSDGNIFFKSAVDFCAAADRAMRAPQSETAAVAGLSAPVSPMAKMALALREKSAAERNDFDRRVQSGEWGAMPEPGTEADALPNHVAEVKGDDAIRILRWSNRVGAFDYPVGTKLYATQPQEAAPGADVEPIGLPFGIIDPDYATFYTKARVTAWQHGYALTLHGSFTRDLDLVAVPWAGHACGQETLVKAIEWRTGLKRQGPPSDKPHGRKAVSLLFPGFEDPRWVDLSVVPLPVADAARAKEGVGNG